MFGVFLVSSEEKSRLICSILTQDVRTRNATFVEDFPCTIVTTLDHVNATVAQIVADRRSRGGHCCSQANMK